MAILLALFSAVSYGVADFVGGLVSRRTSAWAVAVVAQVSASLSTAAVAFALPGTPTGRDLAWAALAGVAAGVGTGFLYRGFAGGRMSVVAPVSAVGAAIVPVVAGFLGGERFTWVVWLGILVALPGIWFVSTTQEDPYESGPFESVARGRGPRETLAEGVVDGLLAGLGFGILFAAIGQVPAEAGLWPLATAQLISIPSVVLLAVGLRADWVPREPVAWWALVAGPLGATATGAFLLATQAGFLTIAGVLASLYPATTVLLAAAILRERIHRSQGAGLALCALAIVMVAGG